MFPFSFSFSLRRASATDGASHAVEAGWSRLRRFWRPSVRAEIDDELAFHMEMRVAEYVAAGLTPSEAAAKAREQFGDVAAVSEGLVRIGNRRRRWLDVFERADALLLDLRFAVRTLRKQWPTSLAAIVVLSLAIGGSVAIFSVVDAVLLRPLPFPDASRVVEIGSNIRARNVVNGGLPAADLLDIRAGATAFSGIAAIQTGPNVPYVIDGDRPEKLRHAFVTTNIFDVLETPVVLGRNFITDDGTPLAPGEKAPHNAILSYEYWQRRFHGDSTAIGRSIVGPWGPTRVIGVASPAARLLVPDGARTFEPPDVWEVLRLRSGPLPRTGTVWHLIARLKPGATLDAARAQLDSIGALLADRYPDSHGLIGLTFGAAPIKDLLVRGARPALLALMSAVAFLLLIACANVGSLLLVRASARERELAVRAAIGGSRRRIVWQLLAESAVLSAIAAAIGVALAATVIRVVRPLTAIDLPRANEIAIDVRVAAFAAGVMIVATLGAGLIPVIRAARIHASDTLRASLSTSAIGAANRLRAMVVVAEVTLSFALLVGCGLMIRTFVTLSRSDLGFDPSGVLTFTLSNRNLGSRSDRMAYVHQVEARLLALPGVEGATISTGLPFSREGTTASWGTRALLADPSRFVGQADLRAVLPGYFELLRIPLLAGRVFTTAEDSVNRNQVIIDDAAAKAAFGDASPIGQTIVTHILGRPDQPFTVVGVVRRERHNVLVGQDRPIIYFPWATGALEAGDWAVRTRGDMTTTARAIGATIQAMPMDFASNLRVGGPDARRVLVNDLQPLGALVDRALAPTRFVLVSLAVFASVAALLTALGLYSVLSSAVRQRTAEIGVRMAFGAESRDIFALIMKHGLRLSVFGLALGVGAALVLTRGIASLLVGVRPEDPITFVATAVVFLGIALLACWLPARRAAALDPSVALREESG